MATANVTPSIDAPSPLPCPWAPSGASVRRRVRARVRRAIICGRRLVTSVGLALIGATAWAQPASTTPSLTFQDLLRRLPDEANAVVVLHTQGIFQSELAKREGWTQQYADAFSEAPLMVPPRATRFVMAAELDLESMRPEWEAAAMELDFDPTSQQIAQRLGGVADRLAGAQVVWPSENLCIARFAPRQFGVLAPASRQDAARWISRGGSASLDAFSPYLVRAANYAAGAGPEIILAIDLENLLFEQTVREAMQRADLFQGRDAGALAPILASLQGLTLGVRVTDRLQGKLLVDFAADPAPLGDLAGPLVVTALQEAGASFAELAQWTARLEGQRIVLEGPLSSDSMRRLFSIMSLDAALVSREAQTAAAPSAPATGTPAATQSQSETARATLRYHRAVSKYLQGIGRGRSPESISQGALWVSNFARRIESLPTRGVDPDLVQTTRRITERMRQSVAYVYDLADQAAAQDAAVRPQGDLRITAVPTWRRVNYGGFIMREYAPMASASLDIGGALYKRQEIADEATAQALQTARELIDQNQADWDEITRTMNARYPLRFE